MKAVRIISWVRRFTKNCQAEKKDRVKGPFITEEIEATTNLWIQHEQEKFILDERFPEHRERLNLQIDQDIYICKGRVQVMYPIFIPPDTLFAEKLVMLAHLRTLHGGVGLTMTYIRKKYWIPRLRRFVRRIIHECHECKRFRAIAFKRPPISTLPLERTTGNQPYQVVGIDYAGPITYRTKHQNE